MDDGKKKQMIDRLKVRSVKSGIKILIREVNGIETD